MKRTVAILLRPLRMQVSTSSSIGTCPRLQSLIDQFVEIQGISYIYIVNDADEYLAHTFVPGIPEEILEGERRVGETVTRNLAGMGDFVEVSSYILAGHVGSVHIGMDVSHVALAIQQAIGNQIYLIAIIFFVGNLRLDLVRQFRCETD